MERIDVLAIALIINAIIFIAYIGYLKFLINILFNIVDNQRDVIKDIMDIIEKQYAFNEQQNKVNAAQVSVNIMIDKHIKDSNIHSPSPTGGRRSEAEAQ